MPKAIINRFDGGIDTDLRTQRSNSFAVSEHFDNITQPHTLRPYRRFINEAGAPDTNKISKLLVAQDGNMYGLGVVGGTNRVKIFKNDSVLPALAWTDAESGASATQARRTEVFVEYKKHIYGAHSGFIWRWGDFTGTPTFDITHRPLTFTHIAQGVVHPKDDNLYIPYDNRIARNDDGTWTNNALIGVPDEYNIVALAPYGNFLAIACSAKNVFGNSVVYLWDRDSSLVTVSDSIDWGNGKIQFLQEMDGMLMGLSSTGTDSVSIKPRLEFKVYSGGGGARLFKQLSVSGTPQVSGIQKHSGRLYFMLSGIEIDFRTVEAVCSLARTQDGGFSFQPEYSLNNSAGLGSHALHGFLFVGDYLWTMYDATGFKFQKIDTQDFFTDSAAYKTLPNHGMPLEHRSALKLLKGVSISYEPIENDETQRISLNVQVDDGSILSSLTTTEQDSAYMETSIYTDGSHFGHGRKFTFEVISRGVAFYEIKYEYEVLDSLV